MRSRFASPGSAYLELVGELAYAVTSLEGLMIFDVPRLSSALPVPFTVERLVGGTTTGIGQQFLDVAPKVLEQDVQTYCAIGGQALRDAGAIRNQVLHSRPATNSLGEQCLYRSITGKDAFFIDAAWLDSALADLATLSDAVNSVRPSFNEWPTGHM